MFNKYSVRLLFQSTHLPDTSGSFFEESIVLVNANSQDEAKQLVKKHFQPDTYLNAAGGQTTVSLKRILDTFQIMEDIDDEDINFKEVYSQFLIYEDEEVSAEEVLERYNKLYGF